MDREILFKAKHEHVVVANKDLEGQWVEGLLWDEDYTEAIELVKGGGNIEQPGI